MGGPSSIASPATRLQSAIPLLRLPCTVVAAASPAVARWLIGVCVVRRASYSEWQCRREKKKGVRQARGQQSRTRTRPRRRSIWLPVVVGLALLALTHPGRWAIERADRPISIRAMLHPALAPLPIGVCPRVLLDVARAHTPALSSAPWQHTHALSHDNLKHSTPARPFFLSLPDTLSIGLPYRSHLLIL